MSTHAGDKNFLYKIAKAYYQDELTQHTIAQRFGLSRVKVSRLLEQARQEGIVKITVVPPPGTFADLERQLEARFGLLEAVVVSPARYDRANVVRELGQAAADCLMRCLKGREILTMSWGTTLRATVDAFPSRNWPHMTVVQMAGGLGRPEAEVYGGDLTRRAAQALGARSRMIPAPGIVASKLARDALLADTHIAETLTMAAHADVALVGLGALTPDSVVLQVSSLLTEEQINELKALGMVGDIALRCYNAYGRPIQHEVNERIIAIELEQIKRIPRVIGVAGGTGKYESIRAALRGSLINVLVTDDRTATRLLSEPDYPHTER